MSVPSSVVYAGLPYVQQRSAARLLHQIEEYDLEKVRMETATVARDRAIVEALEAGVPATLIADMTNLSVSRVYQLRDEASKTY